MTLHRAIRGNVVAGFESRGVWVIRAAPILRWLVDRRLTWAMERLREQGWTVETVA